MSRMSCSPQHFFALVWVAPLLCARLGRAANLRSSGARRYFALVWGAPLLCARLRSSGARRYFALVCARLRPSGSSRSPLICAHLNRAAMPYTMFGIGHSDGRIELIIGPMMSGKTEELSRRVRHELVAGRKVVVAKHTSDDRFGDDVTIATHSGGRISADANLRVAVVGRLSEVDVRGADVVAIDEGQFFEDLVETASAWADSGLRVIVSALNGNSDADPFGRVCELVPRCESVDKLSGVCVACRRRPSSFSVRIDGDAARHEIGGSDKYRSVCRECRKPPPPN